MGANDKQVAGDHYKTNGVQYWDYCVQAETPNLEFNAGKYLLRWRKKGGVSDLEKSIHYIEKRIESRQMYIGTAKGGKYIQSLFEKMIIGNKVPQAETLIINKILHWQSVSELDVVIFDIQELIDSEKGK
jgi:hypothetical protein